MSDSPPWEPPLRGTEPEALLAALERQRVTFRWKAADLDDAHLRTTVGASSLTLGGLLKHLALIEDWYVQVRILGRAMPADWEGQDLEDGSEFSSAAEDDAASLYALWDRAAERSRAAVADIIARGPASDAAQTLRDGSHPNIRRLVLDLLEEYSRHTGHADLIREAIDGRTGEDPPFP